MSSPSSTKKNEDGETHRRVKDASGENTGTKDRAQTNTSSDQAHGEETSDIDDPQGEAARSDVVDLHSSFQQVEDLPPVRPAHENPGGAEEDASLRQIGAMFAPPSNAHNQDTSTTSQRLPQPVISHDNKPDGPPRSAHQRNGSS